MRYCDFRKLQVVRCEDPFEINIQDSNNRVDIDHVCASIAATATFSECTQKKKKKKKKTVELGKFEKQAEITW